MTKFGRNMKVTIARSQCDAFTATMADVLGSTWVDATPQMRIFTMPDGFSLGAQLVGEDEALSDESMFLAPWLEFLVENIEEKTTALLQAGCTTFEYVDTTHTYFRAPGGLVFRLAAID